MWVFHERRYPIIDNKAVQEVKLRIMGVLFSDEIPDVRDIGSDSEKGADFTAIMYSVVSTLSMHGIDVLRWLEAWLTACAENDRKPPDDLSPWLPWSMSEERKREFMAPG